MYIIDKVVVHGRQDNTGCTTATTLSACCSATALNAAGSSCLGWLRDFDIVVKAGSAESSKISFGAAPPFTSSVLTATFPAGTEGDRVRVGMRTLNSYLMLTEVEVYGATL
eukprot:tig00020629_g12387.t1